MAEKTGDPIDREYRAYIESSYSPVPKDEQEKIIDNVITLVEMGHDSKQTLKSTLEYAARMVFKLFHFQRVSVGLRSRKDGYYRYEVIFGHGKDIEEAMRKVKYNYEDMVSNERFPYIKIGRLSELDPAEGVPEWEKDWYMPFALAERRKSRDEFHEGDYIDVWMFSQNRELIGWFEIAGPISKKLPPRNDVRWIELIGAICASIVTHKWAEEDSGQSKTVRTPVPPRAR